MLFFLLPSLTLLLMGIVSAQNPKLELPAGMECIDIELSKCNLYTECAADPPWTIPLPQVCAPKVDGPIG